MNANTKTINSFPDSSTSAPVGGVVIFSLTSARAGGRRAKGATERGTDRLATALESAGLRVLRVDLPERRKAENGATAKAVTSGIARLSSQCGEYGDRIALIAEREAADAIVLGARVEWQVRSFVLLSGRMSKGAKELLAEWRDNPTLCLVSSEDKKSLRDMTDVYFASKHA